MSFKLEPASHLQVGFEYRLSPNAEVRWPELFTNCMVNFHNEMMQPGQAPLPTYTTRFPQALLGFPNQTIRRGADIKKGMSRSGDFIVDATILDFRFTSPMCRCVPPSFQLNPWISDAESHYQILAKFGMFEKFRERTLRFYIAPCDDIWTVKEEKRIAQAKLYFEESILLLLQAKQPMPHLPSNKALRDKIEECHSRRELMDLICPDELEDYHSQNDILGWTFGPRISGDLGWLEFCPGDHFLHMVHSSSWMFFCVSFIYSAMQLRYHDELGLYQNDITGLRYFVSRGVLSHMNECKAHVFGEDNPPCPLQTELTYEGAHVVGTTTRKRFEAAMECIFDNSNWKINSTNPIPWNMASYRAYVPTTYDTESMDDEKLELYMSTQYSEEKIPDTADTYRVQTIIKTQRARALWGRVLRSYQQARDINVTNTTDTKDIEITSPQKGEQLIDWETDKRQKNELVDARLKAVSAFDHILEILYNRRAWTVWSLLEMLARPGSQEEATFYWNGTFPGL